MKLLPLNNDIMFMYKDKLAKYLLTSSNHSAPTID